MSTLSRTRRLPAARRRDQLLAAALDRFGAQGFHDTSMDDIAEEAGVTKPVLYQHFPSKRQLFVELLETVGADMRDAIASSAMSEAEPGRRVIAGFEAYFQFVCENPSSFHLLFNGTRRSDEFAQAITRVEDGFASMISEFIAAPVERDHRDLLAYGIVGAAEVTARRWVRRGEEESERSGQDLILDPAEGRRLARRLGDMFWAGLRALPADAPVVVGAETDG